MALVECNRARDDNKGVTDVMNLDQRPKGAQSTSQSGQDDFLLSMYFGPGKKRPSGRGSTIREIPKTPL